MKKLNHANTPFYNHLTLENIQSLELDYEKDIKISKINKYNLKHTIGTINNMDSQALSTRFQLTFI